MSRKIVTQVQNSKLVEERRNLIIGAAIQVFRRKGYHVATTKDVALAAGVAKPAGQPPDALSFVIYQQQNFMTAFGEVFTPASGPT